MLHWTARKKSGYSLYYFVQVDMTCHVYYRKVAITRSKAMKSHETFAVQFKSRLGGFVHEARQDSRFS